MLEYEEVHKVFLDGKHIGDIKEKGVGFSYYAKGCSGKVYGETFATVAAVKATL